MKFTTYHKILQLLIKYSSAKYCSQETTLEELGIDPIIVIKNLLFYGDLKLEIGNYEDLVLTSDDDRIMKLR